MNTTLLLSGVLATVLIGSLGLSSAYAQYLGNVGSDGETGKSTLEEALACSALHLHIVDLLLVGRETRPLADAMAFMQDRFRGAYMEYSA